jgi:tRNA pseudouridine55 synthase
MIQKQFNDLNDLVEGRILLFDKPLFWTSFDLVKKVKAITEKQYRQQYDLRKKIKVGHAGTLDPLAQGLMVLGTGKKTRTLDTIQALDKEYITTLEMGRTTPSFDLETMFDREYSLVYVSRQNMEETLQEFTGEIYQVPPIFSAKTVNGQRAYKVARKGGSLDLEPNKIFISDIQLLHYDFPVLTIQVTCGKGTYIRSLARDIGEKLLTGAHLIGLQRTRIGDYHLKDAFSLEKFEQKVKLM